MNHLLYVGLVLDSRYKLRYLEYCFGTLYKNQKVVDMEKRVKVVLVDFYNAYTQNQVGVVVIVLLHKPKAKNQVDECREMILVWLM